MSVTEASNINKPTIYFLGSLITSFTLGAGSGYFISDLIDSRNNLATINKDQLQSLRTENKSSAKSLADRQHQLQQCKNNHTKTITTDNKSHITISKESHNELQSRPKNCPAIIDIKTNEIWTSAPAKHLCLTDETPISISNNFDKYSSSENKKIFLDHYSGRWLCDFSWQVTIMDKPTLNNNMYWEVRTLFSNKDLISNKDIKFKSVIFTLKENLQAPPWMVKDTNIKIRGKIVSASQSGIGLVEVDYVRMETD